MKKHAIFAALTALVAMAAVPAMASAVVTLTAPAGTKLKAGDPLTAFSTNLVFAAEKEKGENLECNESDLLGQVATNGGLSSTVKINSATFHSNGGVCATNIPNVTAHVTAPVSVASPWILHFNGVDNWVLTDPIFTATFTQGGVSVAHCTFTATEVTGTYTTGGTQMALIVGTGNFVSIEPGIATCPSAKGTLTGTAFASSKGNNVIAD